MKEGQVCVTMCRTWAIRTKEEDQACGWFRLERPTELSSRQREWHLRSGGSRPQHHRSDPVSDGPGQCPGCACCSEPSRVANLALLLGSELRRRSVPPATGLASKHLTFFRKLLSGSGWNAKILASSSTPPPPTRPRGPRRASHQAMAAVGEHEPAEIGQAVCDALGRYASVNAACFRGGFLFF